MKTRVWFAMIAVLAMTATQGRAVQVTGDVWLTFATNRPLEAIWKNAAELSDIMLKSDLIVRGTIIAPTVTIYVLSNGTTDETYTADGTLVDVPKQGIHQVALLAIEEILASRSITGSLLPDLATFERGVTGVHIVAKTTFGTAEFHEEQPLLMYLKKNDICLTHCTLVGDSPPLYISNTAAVYRMVGDLRSDISMITNTARAFRYDFLAQSTFRGATSRFEVLECTRKLSQAMCINNTNGLESLTNGPVSGLLSRTALRLIESQASKRFTTTDVHIIQHLFNSYGEPIVPE